MGKKSRGNASAGSPGNQLLPGDGTVSEAAKKKQTVKPPLPVPMDDADPQSGPGKSGKRPRSEETSDSASAAKKLLANNKFSVLKDGADSNPPSAPKKEKMPPFYVKGFPPGLWEQLSNFIGQGLRCTIKRCTEGYKLIVPTRNHYNAVLEILHRMKLEFYSHDIEAVKPLKVVLRGLHDMETDTLAEELKMNGLKPVQVFKMARSKANKYRDQLYLVHLEKNSTTVKDLQNIRTLLHIVVTWERYKSIHRGVTQCTNCLLFGHGARNCRMASRCPKCGKQHKINDCDRIEEADPVCYNCGSAHKATSKACPKRAEYLEIRKKASSNNQPGRRRMPENNNFNFPPLTSTSSSSAATAPTQPKAGCCSFGCHC